MISRWDFAGCRSHGVEGVAEMLQFISRSYFRTSCQVTVGDLFSGACEGRDGLCQFSGKEKSDENADGETEERHKRRTEVHVADVGIEFFQGKTNVDPAPIDAGILERV